MTALTRIITICAIGAALSLTGCGKKNTPPAGTNAGSNSGAGSGSGSTGGTDPHAGHAHGEEVSLGSAMVGDMKVEFAQGHGLLEPGKEMHLVVKLPYNDNGASIVRAWIGTENRLASIVGKGDYAPSHDDYDLHATAPNPVPANVKWWVEVEKPDGTKAREHRSPVE